MTLDIEALLAIISSAASSLRMFLPKDKHLNLTFLKDVKFFSDEKTRNLVEGLTSSLIATIFWSLTYHSQRIDFLSPEGFVIVVASIFTGPLALILWSLQGWKQRELSRPKIHRIFKRWPFKASCHQLLLGSLVFMALIGLGFGYVYGLMRPYGNGFVISKFAGLDDHEQTRLKDNLQVNLERLRQFSGSDPRYSGEAVDIDSAEKVAFDANRRFVIWGSVYIEETSGNLTADISIRVRDLSRHQDTYHPEEYRVAGTTRGEIFNRITGDITVVSVWTLGSATAGYRPTNDSAVNAIQILAQLPSERIHNDVQETKQLGVLLMDMGYKDLFGKIVKTGSSWAEIASIYESAISSSETWKYRGYETALARLYYYYANALSNIPDNESHQTALSFLDKSIISDQQYPMPHHLRAWLTLESGGSEEDMIKDLNEFIQKFDEAYGRWAESAQRYFNEYEEVTDWLEKLQQKVELNQ